MLVHMARHRGAAPGRAEQATVQCRAPAVREF